MADKKEDDGIELGILELEDIPAPLLRKLLRRMAAKRVSERTKDDEDESAEEDRKKLSEMHEEKKGSSPKVPVSKDDLPADLEEMADEDEEGEDKEKTEKKKA